MMKKVIVLIVSIIWLIVLFHYVRPLFYSISLRPLVKQTISEIVKEEALKP